jgi:hypothetical protein
MRVFTLSTFVLLPLLLMLSACDNPQALDCVKSAGSQSVEIKQVAPFVWLIVDDNIDLYLNNDSSEAVTIEGGKNLIGKIRLDQTGDSLRIYNANHCNWARSYASNKIKVTVGAANLRAITNRGYGNVQSAEKLKISDLVIYILEGNGDLTLDMQAESFYVYTNCSPTITLTGETNSLGAWSRDAGKLLAEGLIAQDCDIRNSSANEMRVFPVRKLRAVIEESGNIVYFHEPRVLETDVSGTGKVVRK